MSQSVITSVTHRASFMPMTVVITLAVVGGVAIVALFVFLTVWLYRRRYRTNQDEEDATGSAESYKSNRKDFRLLELQQPKMARLASPSSRMAILLPKTTSVQTNEKDSLDASISPPPRSSVWRGKQWVTITRSKIPAKQQKQPRNPISEKIVINEPQKRSRMQRLSLMISRMKSEFMDVEL